MASNIKGITIQIGGDTSGLEKALSDTNKSINTTKKELKEVEKGLKLDPKNVTLLTQKQTLLSNAIKDTSSKLSQLKQIKDQAEKSNVDKNTKEWRDLERQILETERALKDYNNQQEQLKSGSSVVKGLASGLDDAGKSAKLSGAELGGWVTVVKAGVDVAKGFINVAKEVAKSLAGIVTDATSTADEINTLAKQYQLTTKQIQEYMLASELIDTDLNTITKSMAKLTRNMTSNSTGVINAFKKLGIETKNTDGTLRDSNVVFNETIEALGKIQNETEQDSVAMEIFGKSANELGSLINGGAQQLAEFNKYLEENNLLLTQEELDSLNGLNDGFDTMSATITAIKNKLAVELVPALQPIVDDLLKYVIEHKDDIINTAQEAVEWLTGPRGQELWEKVKECAENVANMLFDIPTITHDLELLATPLKIIADIISVIAKAVEGMKWFFLSDDFNKAWADKYGDTPIIMAPRIATSGGFGDKALASGGFMSAGVTLNANFTINNGHDIDQNMTRKWALDMVNVINEELGKRV